MFKFTKNLFILIILSKVLFPAWLFASADVFFDVKSRDGCLRLTLKEKDTTIVDDLDLTSFKGSQHFGHTFLERDDDRFFLHYRSSVSEARMGVMIRDNGDIELKNSMDASASSLNGDELEFYEPAVTLNDKKWTWQFQTSGKLINTANLLFHILETQAHEFHNYGIIKALTATMRQTYKFNAGVFDFGDGLTPISEAAYAEALNALAYAYPHSQPQFAHNTVDDYGLTLSTYGHIIRGLTYKVLGVYLNQGDVELDHASFINASCGIPCCSHFLEGFWVGGCIKGTSPLFQMDAHAFVGGFDESASIGHLAVKAGVQMTVSDEHDQPSAYSIPFDALSNEGEIFCAGLMKFKSLRFPSDLGKISAVGIGFDILKDVDTGCLKEAPPQHIKGKIRTIVRQKNYVEYYLNTITRHYQNGYFTHTTETGPVFQYKVLIGESEDVKEISESADAFSLMMQFSQSKARRGVIEKIKDNIRQNLHKLAAAGLAKNDLMYGLMQALVAAGLADEAIEDVLCDPEIDSLLDGISGFDFADEDERSSLTDKSTTAGSLLSELLSIKKGCESLHQWTQQNMFQLVGMLCSEAGRAVAKVPHPAAKVGGVGMQLAGSGCFAYARAQAIQQTQGYMGERARFTLTQQGDRLRVFLNENKGKSGAFNPNPGMRPDVGEKARIIKPHGNSKNYVGDTHVYVVRNAEENSVHKVGQSMKGVNKQGQSRRAQAQTKRLEKQTGERFRSEIRETFSTKAEALEYETRLIKTFRRMQGEDKLPGNKGVH